MKMPIRVREIELDGDYKGFKCTVDASMPMYIFTYLQTGNWDLIQSALSHVIRAWNFTDTEGKALPQPQEKMPALDAFGKPVSIPVLNSDNTPKLDDDGSPITEPVLIPAVALVSVELGMMIVKLINEAVTDTPDP